MPKDGNSTLQHYVVSRYDAPHDSGLRDRSLFDPGSSLLQRLGIAQDTLVLARPDEHIAAIVPMDMASGALLAAQLDEGITGMPPAIDKENT